MNKPMTEERSRYWDQAEARERQLMRAHRQMEREAREHNSFVHNFMHMVSQRQGDVDAAPELDHRQITREEREAVMEALEVHEEDYERWDTSAL